MKRKITMAKKKSKKEIIPEAKSRGLIILSTEEKKKVSAVARETKKLKRILND